MAFGIGEDPRRSYGAVLVGVDYPATRADLVEAAEYEQATPDVINLLKSLPDQTWQTAEDVLRDVAEAARRFGMGNFGPAEQW